MGFIMVSEFCGVICRCRNAGKQRMTRVRVKADIPVDHTATTAKLLQMRGWPAAPLSHTVHNGYRRIHTILRKGLGRAMLACGLLLPTPAPAGGGPENVLLVVNGDSAVSMQIANRYVELRDIPQEHVIRLQDIPLM